MPQNEVTKVLSTRLEELIESKKDNDYKLSDKKQAEQMGIPYPSFVKYKGDNAECPASAIVKMAEYYDVSTDYLLGRTNNPSSDIKFRKACDYMGISPRSGENIRAITQSGGNVDILLELEELKGIVEMLNKIKTISVGKRYYNERIKTEFEEMKTQLLQAQIELYSNFSWAIRRIEERHLSGDISVNSDDPDDVNKQYEDVALPGVNNDEVYTDRLSVAAYRLTKDYINKALEAVENDTSLDDKLFKNFDYKVGAILDKSLTNLHSNLKKAQDNYTGEELNINEQKIRENIEALEKFIKSYNERFRKDGDPNG